MLSLILLSLTLLSPPLYAAGTAPVADAGLGVLAYPGDTVVLNGTGSSDVDGEHLSYIWTQIYGARVEIIDGPTSQPSFTIPEAGAYRFQLVVDDGTLESAPDDVAFYVPDREATPDGETGCATPSAVPSLSGITLLAALTLGRRHRRRPSTAPGTPPARTPASSPRTHRPPR